METGVGGDLGKGATRTIVYDDRHRVDYQTHRISEGTDSILEDFDYDEYGNRTLQSRTLQVAGAQPIATSYVYDAFGRETSRTDRDGYVHVTEYEDGTGLLKTKYTYVEEDSGNVLTQAVYVYEDGKIKKVKIADHDGPFALNAPDRWIETTYDYDDYGRVITKTIGSGAGSFSTGFQYDYQDRLTKITFPGSVWKEYRRNGRGQVKTTLIGHGTSTDATNVYEYYPHGNPHVRRCEGCTDCDVITEFEYDGYNRLTKKIVKPAGE